MEPLLVSSHMHVPHLNSLILNGNPNIGHGGTVPLITSLITSLEDWNYSLQVLSLGNTGIRMEDCRALTKLLSLSTDIVKFYKTFCDACLAATFAAGNGDTSLLEVVNKFDIVHNYEARSKLSLLRVSKLVVITSLQKLLS